MKNTSLPGKPNVYVPLAILFVILVLILPRNAKFSYDYKKGSPWSYETLIAQFDFPILKTQEEIQKEKSEFGSSVIPYYRFSEEVVNKSIKTAENLSLGEMSGMRSTIISQIRSIYDTGVVPDEGVKVDRNSDMTGDVLYIQRDKRAAKYPVTEVYKESDAKARLLAALTARYPKVNMDSVCKAAGVYDVISPNLIFDKQTTILVHSESGNYISPTHGYVSAGQLIVSKGEIVTGEIAQMLDSYKVEYEASMGYSGPRILFWTGNALIAFALVALLYMVIFFSNADIFQRQNKYLYILLIFLLATIAALAVSKHAPNYLYMVPFTLTAIYLQSFFRNKLVIPICAVALLPLLIFAHNGAQLYFMFLVASLVSLFTFRIFARGWLQFVSAFLVFLSLLVTYLGFRLIDALSGNLYLDLLFLFIGSMLSVAGYPVVYLFEKIFNLVSTSRLVELCDTNNTLLRRLEHEAPGTFQHSLQVMNMCESVARSLNANVLLVKAGALYHDIGKMNNPLCFIENETLSPAGERYHQGLTPLESARDITAHVTDGLELAGKYRLPEVVSDFIRTHHGTSSTAFFFNKFLSAGGDPDSEEAKAFFYKGSKPVTREQIILMVCDSIEAASRTLKDFAPATVDSFVEGIVASKMNAGQFEDADISIKDINTLKSVLKSYIAQVHHERVVYPKHDKSWA